MGYPVGYSEMMLPRVVLNVLLLLGHLHRFLLWAFHAVGLGDLIDLAVNYPMPASETAQQDQQGSAHGHGEAAPALQHWRPAFRPVPAVVVDEALPVVRYGELVGTACVDVDCAVCLCGIGAGDEVRRLGNCRHAFHRGCIDRWMAHDQRTCPLCRAPLFQGDLGAAAEACPADDDLSYPSLLSPLPTQTLLRPQELLLNGLGGFQ